MAMTFLSPCLFFATMLRRHVCSRQQIVVSFFYVSGGRASTVTNWIAQRHCKLLHCIKSWHVIGFPRAVKAVDDARLERANTARSSIRTLLVCLFFQTVLLIFSVFCVFFFSFKWYTSLSKYTLPILCNFRLQTPFSLFRAIMTLVSFYRSMATRNKQVMEGAVKRKEKQCSISRAATRDGCWYGARRELYRLPIEIKMSELSHSCEGGQTRLC